MKTNYHKWLELKVINNYFPRGICEVLNIVPSKETARHFKNYNMLMKKNGNRFSFYIGTASQSTFDFNKDFEGLTDLYFQVITDDPLFFNYTDIPYLNGQQICYFDNTSNPEVPDRLQQNQFTGTEDLIAFKQKRLTVQLPAGKTDLEIKKNDGESIKKVSVDGSKAKNYQLDLNSQDEGVYELWLNNQRQEIFFLGGKLPENCLGVLHFNIENLIHGDNGPRYNLTFNARSVYWQYRVVVRETRKIEVVDMRITGVREEKYAGPEKQQIADGRTAQVFTTTTPVRLQYRLAVNPQLQLTYSNDFSDKTNQLDINLPNPDIEELKKYHQGEHEGSFLLSTIVYV